MRLPRILIGLFFIMITFIVRTYPSFFLEYGRINTEKGLMIWSWGMLVVGVVIILSSIIPIGEE